MITEKPCVTIKCDRCKDGWSDGSEWEGVPHFADLNEAVAFITTDADDERKWAAVETFFDYDAARDGEIPKPMWLCYDCVKRQRCHDLGSHMWTVSACHCGGERHGDRLEYLSCQDCPETEQRTVEGETCEPPYPPPFAASQGSRLIEHRANWHRGREQRPEWPIEPHVVPDAVEDLVAQGAAIAARIDQCLPDGYQVR